MGATPAEPLLIRGVHVATMVPGDTPYGAVRDAALIVRGGRVDWVGPESALPTEARAIDTVLEGEGRWLTPGLVDCHTHLVFGGHRALEFEERLGGATYADIARRGGGILSTVRATRAASEAALTAGAAGRLRTLACRGVTAVEMKSGYGLDPETELRMLRAARAAASEVGIPARTTLLGAHALPPEFAHDREGYVSLVCSEMIPRAASEGLADAVDVFCEGIAFTPAECARVLAAGAGHGLAGRVHADQLSDLGGAALAAEHGARSADHLEFASAAGVAAMARAATVAVLLPGAAYFLREAVAPPVAAFRAAGVPMAVATDMNPGSSPLLDPLLALNLACVLFRTTPEESLAGMTRVAARVLDWEAEMGTVEAGKRADLVLWSVDHPSELSYWMGAAPSWCVIRGGVTHRGDGA